MTKFVVTFQEQEKAIVKEIEVEAAAYLVENGDLTFFSTVDGTTYSNRVASFRRWLSVIAVTALVGGGTQKKK